MSKHSSPALTMRDALYEAPGPRMRAKIRIGTAISLVAVAALVALVLQRFYVTGQLSVHYWYFFTHLTTWKFLLAGFEGTVKVALTAGAIALVLGLALMLGRTSDIKPLQLVCRVLTDFFRGVPSLLFIYFFFFQAVHLADEMEIFFRGEIVYQEAVVNESAGKVLPVFTFAYVYIFDGDISAVSSQQIQYQAEKGGLSGSVITYQTQHITLIDDVIVNIYSGLFAEFLLQIIYLNHNHKS